MTDTSILSKLYIDFSNMAGGTFLGDSAAPHYRSSKILRPPLPLNPPNCKTGDWVYETIYDAAWSSVPDGGASAPIRYKYHITINPAPDSEYIQCDSPLEHISYFKTVIKELQSKILYQRCLGVYENDGKKLHFHLLVQTKEIKSLLAVLLCRYGGLRKSKYAIVSKPINLNRYNKNILKNCTFKMRKQLMKDQITYIQNVYMQKEDHNKKNCLIYSQLKNI